MYFIRCLETRIAVLHKGDEIAVLAWIFLTADGFYKFNGLNFIIGEVIAPVFFLADILMLVAEKIFLVDRTQPALSKDIVEENFIQYRVNNLKGFRIPQRVEDEFHGVVNISVPVIKFFFNFKILCN